MNKKISLKEVVGSIVEGFNKNNEAAGNPERFRIEIQEKELIINALDKKKNLVPSKTFVGRLLLYVRKYEAERIVHHLDIPLPPSYTERLKTDWQSELFKYFLYDAIGLFCLTTNQMVDTRQKAAFDNEKNRLEVDPIYKNKKLKVVNDDETTWYKKGEEYDVFSKGENGWAVFSDNTLHISNNGIGMVRFIHCNIIDL